VSGFGARKGWNFLGGLLRLTVSASGLNLSAGGKRGRVGINTRGVKRASVNLGGGFRWTRSRK
jgi:hypothetical protein